jgi:hypothetical protein
MTFLRCLGTRSLYRKSAKYVTGTGSYGLPDGLITNSAKSPSEPFPIRFDMGGVPGVLPDS